jgi:hypothetical protein
MALFEREQVLKGTKRADLRGVRFAEHRAISVELRLTSPDLSTINVLGVRVGCWMLDEPPALLGLAAAIPSMAASGTFTALIDGTTLRTVSDVQPGRVAEPVSVPGTGYVIMRINADKYRRARVVGRLPDNEPFSSGTLSPFGKSYQLAAARLYRKAAGGAFGGQVHVLDHPGEDQAATPIPLGILGDLTWRRAAWNKSPSFNRGIASRIPVEGLFYPVPGNRGLPEVLGAIGNTADATLALSGGDLPAPSAGNNQLTVGLR